MKKFTLSLAFALSFGFAATAQNHSSISVANDNSSVEQTRELAQKIGLNEKEYITLRKLSQEKATKSAEIENMYSNDPEMREMKLREINAHFDASFLAVLNTTQQQSYAAYKKAGDIPNTIAGTNEDDRSAMEKASN